MALKMNGINVREFKATKDAPKDVVLPQRSTKGSAGYDFYVPQEITIAPGETAVVKTYIKAYMDIRECLLIVPRSSLFKKHKLLMVNSIGVIDSDYADNQENDGNIGAILYNFSDVPQTLTKHEKFIQGIFCNYGVVANDRAIGVRNGGFGSTGV